ncbi:MAG: choline kinase family protein [Muricomes sp.]
MEKKIVEADLAKISQILQHIISPNASYIKVERMGGLTNHTYYVLMNNMEKLIVRLPGEGTEELICRLDEKVSTELACSLNIDADLIYFGDDGTKISRYIEHAATMSPETMREEEHIHQAAKIFRTLHTCGIDTKVPFEVFEMAASYERIIIENKVSLYKDYADIKMIVMKIKESIDSIGHSNKVPCHNDPLCENWVMGREGMYLIDWEYAGMNDAMWDLADISIEAEYDERQDKILLQTYFGRLETLDERNRFLANKIYLDYLWTLWGLTRVPFDGKEMQDYADTRYLRLKRNLSEFKVMEEQII